MTWLRIDDKFTRHPKVTRLARSDRWTWLEVLCYCAEYHTGGYIQSSISEVVPKASQAFLNRCIDLHLLDVSGDDYRVHDWLIYNGSTVRERVFAYLDDHPEASANDVQRDVGGNRKLVLTSVLEYQQGGSTAGTTSGTKSVTRARSPSPSPTQRDLDLERK
jgi:hypothetical protein